MMARLFQFLNDTNWTDFYAVLVWASVLLAVSWVILLAEDPANNGLPEWDLRLRRFGVIVMVAGFLLSVLVGGDKAWTPWWPMVLIIFGFDFYLAAAIFTGRRRARMLAAAALIASDARPAWAKAGKQT